MHLLTFAISQLQLPPWSSQVWNKNVRYSWAEDCSPDGNILQAKCHFYLCNIMDFFFFFVKEGVFWVLWRRLFFFPLMYSLIYYFLYSTSLLIKEWETKKGKVFLLLKHARHKTRSWPLTLLLCLFHIRMLNVLPYCKYLMATLSIWEQEGCGRIPEGLLL